MAGLAPPHDHVYAGSGIFGFAAEELGKKGAELTVPLVKLMLNSVLERAQLTPAEAIEICQRMMKRNKRATRSHLKRHSHSPGKRA